MKIKLLALAISCLCMQSVNAASASFSATADDCINALKGCMLQVTPPLANSNQKSFKVKTLCNGSFEFYSQKLVQDQIAQRNILGTKLCKGVVSYSDLQLPFFKSNAVKDADDGLLAIGILRQTTAEVTVLLQQMEALAAKAATGDYSPTQLANLNEQFGMLLAEINRLAHVTTIVGLNVLDGSTDQLNVSIPSDHGRFQTFPIQLFNLTTGSAGLNIATLDILTKEHGQAVIPVLQAAEQQAASGMKDASRFEALFVKTTEQFGVITAVDLNGAVFVVTKTKKG